MARGALYLLAGAALRRNLGGACHLAGPGAVPQTFPWPQPAAAPVRHDAGAAGAGGGVWHAERLRQARLAGNAVWLAGRELQFFALWSARYPAGASVLQYAAGHSPAATGAGEHSHRAATTGRAAGDERLAAVPLCGMACVTPPDLTQRRTGIYAVFCQLCNRAVVGRRAAGHHHRTGDLSGLELRLRSQPRCAAGADPTGLLPGAGGAQPAFEPGSTGWPYPRPALARSAGQPGAAH